MANLGEAPPPGYGDEWTEGAHNSMEMLKAMREVWDGEQGHFLQFFPFS